MPNFPQYLSSEDMYYPSVLGIINKKKGNPLQPIFEAFTNSLESFEVFEKKSKGKIDICIYFKKDLHPDDSDLVNFDKIMVCDNGVGFNDIQYKRVKMLRDSRKGPSNKGTGRIQFIHYFEETVIESIFKDETSSTGYKKRSITLSKSKKFIDRNSIMRIDEEGEISSKETKTTVVFLNPIENTDANCYTKLNADIIKEEFIQHYLALFCEMQKDFPKISIKTFINNREESKTIIEPEEIPVPNKTHHVDIYYSKIENNKIKTSDKKEVFELKVFRLKSGQLEKNEIKLVSKGEIARGLYFDGLLPQEEVKGTRFLFLLSGKYIDDKDTDTRGQIRLLDSKEFLSRYTDVLGLNDDSNSAWIEQHNEEILISDIENITNNEILKLYPEIDVLRKSKNNKIDELKEMFLLNPNVISKSKITINDSYEDILTKVYREEARLIAQKDALFRTHFRKIKELMPGKNNYQNDFNNAMNEFVKDIPLRDKISLAKYVARRRLVLDVFENIIHNEDKKRELGGRIDESILHNLIFQQSSDDPENSDLWLINEDFIYFNGVSNAKLSELQYEGQKIIKDEEKLTKEQINWIHDFNKRRLDKKPDVLLFPHENKCIIIEFKGQDVPVAHHLNQINDYATLLLNFTVDEYKIDTFYGYLIGENINSFDVKSADSDFKLSYKFDFLFRPSKQISGFFDREGKDGSIYMEIIKYSTLLERAKERNKIFIKKLGIDIDFDNFIV